MTVTTTSGTCWTLTNPAPLRLVPTDDPYTDERSLDGHWSTKLPVGTMGKAVQLPWRVLTILHCRPGFGPSQTPVLDLRHQGGDLLEDLPPALASKLNGATKGWDQLTQRRGWQINQSLVVWLTASLVQRCSEVEVRRRVQAVLPMATFFTIIWY